MWTFIIVLMVFFLIVLVAAKRGLQLKQLALHGQPVKGEVIKIVKYYLSGTSAYRMKYRFVLPNNISVENMVSISSDDREKYGEGGPVDIIYLPQKVRVNALASMVDKVRVALDKTPNK